MIFIFLICSFYILLLIKFKTYCIPLATAESIMSSAGAPGVRGDDNGAPKEVSIDMSGVSASAPAPPAAEQYMLLVIIAWLCSFRAVAGAAYWPRCIRCVRTACPNLCDCPDADIKLSVRSTCVFFLVLVFFGTLNVIFWGSEALLVASILIVLFLACCMQYCMCQTE